MRRKIKANLIGIVIIIIISALIEVICFNFGYLILPKEAKGLQKLDYNSLQLTDMQISGNKLIIKGANPSFKIKDNFKILYLEITPDPVSKAFSMIVKKNKDTIYSPQKFEFNSNYKQNSYLRVNDSTDNVSFNIIPSDKSNLITINSITIDNTFNFNLVRFLLIFFMLFVISFFLFYKEIVKKKLHVTFLIVILTFGIIVSLSTPLNFSFDERAHFIKAYQGASFDLGINKKPIKWVGNIDKFTRVTAFISPFDTYKEKLEYSRTFSSTNYTKTEYISTTADNYLPTAYIPASIGLFIGKALKLPFSLVFYLGRVFGVLGYALVLFYTIKKVKVAKRLIFVIGLLPGIVYSVSSYSADAMTIAFSISTVAVFLNMITSKENSLNYKLPIILTICCSIVVMCKMTYAPLCLLILLIPRNKFKEKVDYLKCRLSVIGTVGVVTLGTIGYSIFTGINQWHRSGVNPAGQLIFIIYNIPEYILIICKFISTDFFLFFRGSIGDFAYAGLLPNILMYIVFVILFVLAIIDNEDDILKIDKSDKLMLSLIILVSWVLVITSLYISFTFVGSTSVDGVQGRYFTPLLLLFLLLFKNNKINNSFNKKKFNYILSVSSTLLVVFTAIKIFLLFNN